jgi:hypothetical protein
MAKKTTPKLPKPKKVSKKDVKKAAALRTVRAILPDSAGTESSPHVHSNVGHSGTPEPTVASEVGSPEAGYGA